MKNFLLVANLSIALSLITTFFHSPITQNIHSHALRRGMNMDKPITHTDVSFTDNATMSAHKGTPFLEVQVFRERA